MEEDMKNYTSWPFQEDLEVSAEHADPDYEQFLADVWVGIVLTLMVLSCVCCMCSCLLYHKFQQWKRSVIEARNTTNIETGVAETSDLPSYTIASGLPTYQEALEQLKKVKETKGGRSNGNTQDRSPSRNLSVANLFSLYKQNNEPTKPA